MQLNVTSTKPTKGLLLFYFFLSIILNSIGNALTVAINLGSALWTAASVNLDHVLAVSLSLMMFVPSFLIIIVNIIILKKVSLSRIIGNLVFLVPFSLLVGQFSTLLGNTGINNLAFPIRIALDCLGVCLISVAISLYQRVNWMLHPVDDLMQIVRFKYFKGNSVIAQLVVFTPPLIAIIISVIITHQIYAVNIGTIFALVFQGALVGIADKYIFPSLKHQNIDK
ncbi:hypothetical protein LB941_08065 [Ligilactobacillus sp. WILCCON 0076]|uniref:Sugar specific permease n=1 Tax=Ligilactobacillus ubinensis TaxID=2876789 RepID=A0A9X2FME2_9LACO|nr:hypothetical protein [Ligilactobacillus ubinensis]MCP0887286.1 hypothetical protein [Ligilactobacillus ubinensis]